MKVYLAGKYQDKERCSDIMRLLEDEGDTITCDWTHHKYSDEAYPKQYCQDDLDGVKACDVFVGVFLDAFDYRGALVEFGIALGLDKKIVLLGHAIDSCIFTHHPDIIKVENVGELLYNMSTLAEQYDCP